MPDLSLRMPSLDLLPAYQDALVRGWSPSNVRGAKFNREQLDRIAREPKAFVASLDDPGAIGGDVKLPDGTSVPRLPSFVRWIWDGDFCGSISLRWTPDGSELPPHVLGHIGYAVVPWRRKEGIATWALGAMLSLAQARGLQHVEITCREDNYVSESVIRANGGRCTGLFREPKAYGGHPAIRFQIDLV